MNRYFYCKKEWRKKEVKNHDTLNGIDYLEVEDDPASEDEPASKDEMRQRILFVYFVKPLASKLARENVRIDGGVRSRNIGVKEVDPRPPDKPAEALKVELCERGDFSNYTLRLVKVAPNDLFSVSETLSFLPSVSDPALAELGLESPTEVSATLSSDLSRFDKLTNDPAKIEVKIGSEGPHGVQITGRHTDLHAAAQALEVGIKGAYPSASFEEVRVLRVNNRLLVLPKTSADTIEFFASGDDPALRELGLQTPAQVKGLLSSDLSGFAELTKDPAKIEARIGSEYPYHEIQISGKPADLNAARAELEKGIRAAHQSAPFKGARVVRMDHRLLVVPGTERFDPALSAIQFSFKVGCPSEFDCKPKTVCPPEKLTKPEINYLAKDYPSFRRLMLDRLSIIMPDWRERNPADMQVALVELLAYVGDHLSYHQDAVATEAYLGTARRRVSVRRHARLLDYFLHDGCNARAWVWVEVEPGGDAEGQELLRGTPLLTGGSDGQKVIAEADLQKAVDEEKPLVFETMHKIKLHSSHNEISFYTWSDSECCLPRGSTRATLRDDPTLFLEPGDVLIFEEVLSPTTGTEGDTDPTHSHAVRLKEVSATVDQLNNTPVTEIEWYEADALPFPLCISALVKSVDGKKEVKETSVARGNIVLADHGCTVTNESRLPAVAQDQADYRPQLQHKEISFSVAYDHEEAKSEAAASVLKQNPRKAIPSKMTLKDADETWNVRRDLLGSDRFATDFVVEIEQEGWAQLRFGDDVLGKKPSADTEFTAKYRVGNGRVGNLGADKITRIVCGFQGIGEVKNPLPAVGGTDPETMEEVRQFAPHAFRRQQRAVTEADYAEMTEQHPEVQKAAATFRWTGSWHSVFVTVDRKGGFEVDSEFETGIRRHLEQYRLAGYDLEVNGPRFVPLDILMTVCVKPGYFRSYVKESLLKVFSRHDLPDGVRGFFHPDNFTFGQPVYLSQIYKRAMEVGGVASVEVKRFQRCGKKPNNEKEQGFLKPDSLEVIRLDNDPNFPENGSIDFEMHGGL